MDKIIQKMIGRYPALQGCAEDLESMTELLCTAFRGQRKVLVCGNGGSAADAEHISGEMLKQFMKKRSFQPAEAEKLGSLAECLQPGLPVIPLVSFSSLLTAYSNDCAPEYVFAQLVQSLGSEGDVLIAISTSGNSKNICLAAQTARALGMNVAGLTGESGGLLAPLCDVCLKAPSSVVYEIQEFHQPLYHALCLLVEDRMFV